MRITIMAIGSRGDVQPLVALGTGLRQKGHLVNVAAGDEFASLALGAGLEFSPLGVNIQTAMQGQRDLFRFMKSIKDRVVKACPPEQDAILSTFLGVSTCPIARERKIPFFYAVPIPGLETQEFPNPVFPSVPFWKPSNIMTYRVADKRATRAYPDAGSLFLEPRPTYLFYFSKYLVSKPQDWGEFAHVTGYWFLDRPSDWQPPAALEEFLRAGAAPVVVSFGSTVTRQPEKLANLVMDALASLKQRAVLVTGWGGLKAGRPAPSVFVADSIPFDWLFPRMKAAIHHGGTGTLAAALRAGIPSVMIPFGPDQSFWAQRAQKLGVAVEAIPAAKLTVEKLAEAIRFAVEDWQIREKAARMGEKIRDEDGVGNAVRIIEQVLANGRGK
jgi:sterol 3beta-glucosyltransferase